MGLVPEAAILWRLLPVCKLIILNSLCGLLIFRKINQSLLI